MNSVIDEPRSTEIESALEPFVEPARPAKKFRVATVVCLPLATLAAGTAHFLMADPSQVETQSYLSLLGGLLAISALLPLISWFRPWASEMFPILTAAVVLTTVWDVVTTGLHWLPLPYCPGPAAVLQSVINDRRLLAESTAHSLLLLASGYCVGVIVALVTGISIGWSSKVRYWGMPLLKFVGPIPATAWVPLALILSPRFSAMGLIALAVWFPVTMLTASGVSNTKASYLDVARTLGANQSYLIFRVAIPAAMPNIFIGLFMGLGTSFLTLIVAETVGVKAGLGWYVSWAQGWAEYGKVYGALIIMAVFFSTIMTILFKIRDRVLSWQKGVIKW